MSTIGHAVIEYQSKVLVRNSDERMRGKRKMRTSQCTSASAISTHTQQERKEEYATFSRHVRPRAVRSHRCCGKPISGFRVRTALPHG